MLNNSVVLVTGGTGSWGYELINQLLTFNPKKIIIFSRNENNQVKMSKEFNDDRLYFFIGDIRDKEALVKAFKGVDYVFHLAALKHVPICEMQPLEALKTNVNGTQNVIEAAIKNNVSKLINVSTDKAADPANFYGITKALGERLVVYANLLNTNTRFISIRGGNVLGSSGSVLHLFKDQIKENNQIKLTDTRMTRFFLTPQKTTRLLLEAAEVGKGGEIFVMNAPACKIIDLAKVLLEIRKSETEVTMIECGTRPGEKLHETLVSSNEVNHTVVYNKELFVVLPTINIPKLKQVYNHYAPIKDKEYSSKHNLITKKAIKKMLIEGDFLNKL